MVNGGESCNKVDIRHDIGGNLNLSQGEHNLHADIGLLGLARTPFLFPPVLVFAMLVELLSNNSSAAAVLSCRLFGTLGSLWWYQFCSGNMIWDSPLL